MLEKQLVKMEVPKVLGTEEKHLFKIKYQVFLRAKRKSEGKIVGQFAQRFTNYGLMENLGLILNFYHPLPSYQLQYNFSFPQSGQ